MNTYLILYGADNEFWLLEADNLEDAIAEFKDSNEDGDINEIYLCIQQELPK